MNGDFLRDLRKGLGGDPKTLACKYLYDERGSELFHKICLSEEYYLSDTENELLEKYAAAIEGYAKKPITLIEFGCGDGKKSETLIAGMTKVARFIPMDICAEVLKDTADRLAKRFPDLRIEPVEGDFTAAMPDLTFGSDEQPLGFFSGSTIGNLEEAEAAGFLRSAAAFLGEEAMFLLSADLAKGLKTLSAAYNDKQGHTASFNLNLLRRINRELGGNFDLRKFSHEGRWNEAKSRMEMHLVSLADQKVEVRDTVYRFKKGETIQTENCRKYSIPQLKQLAETNRWRPVQTFTDPNRFFSLNLLAA